MAIKGILFDLYGTLVDIETDEGSEEIYRGIAHFLTYRGLYLHRGDVRDRYYQIMKEQKEASAEEYPEIDVEAIWDAFLLREGILSARVRRDLALVLAQLHRGISRNRLRLYRDVKPVLDTLRRRYRLAIVSDAQPCFALPEMKAMGIAGYFDPVTISAPYGYRKPDLRLFKKTLEVMDLTADEVICVGNDMYRDIYGATRMGIKTIFIDSNQGIKSHEDVVPDYVAHRFADLPDGVEALSRISTNEPDGEA
jgi:putative hydrolase of the HAD superfamily